MKTFLKLVVVLFAAISSTQMMAQDHQQWMLDKAHTSVDFSVNHFFSEVKGNFTEFDGKFLINPSSLENGQISFTVNVSSINTNNEKRDSHLESKDFFDSKEYPTMHFKSTSIQKVDDNNYIAVGDLTIKDVTNVIEIPFEVTGQMEHPMMKGVQILGLHFHTTLNRTNYGVGTGDWAATMVVGDLVNISIPMELNLKSM